MDWTRNDMLPNVYRKIKINDGIIVGLGSSLTTPFVVRRVNVPRMCFAVTPYAVEENNWWSCSLRQQKTIQSFACTERSDTGVKVFDMNLPSSFK
jgi:hypothetical protein